MKKKSILFVCLGNICRSPCAHAIFLHLDTNSDFEIESAGTSGYHIGQEMDRRMQNTLQNKGITFFHKARQFKKENLNYYDHIICMDEDNYFTVLMKTETETQKKKVCKLRDFDPKGQGDVPDPYYENNFEEVYEIIYRSCKNLFENLS